MQNNDYYFEVSKKNPEKVFEPFYEKKKEVIPKDASLKNELIKNNNKMIEQISAFKNLIDSGLDKTSQPVVEVVKDIVQILTKTENINYSAFCQFFMVYNSTHSFFTHLNSDDKFEFVYQMLIRYCKERHDMYCNYGYSDMVLQVLCDNYSHKRNSKTSIDKVLSILQPHNLTRLTSISKVEEDNYFFLPDKGDKNLFEDFLKHFNLRMESRLTEHNKYPDLVLKLAGHYYICELKTMKGIGGGQSKQIVELANFLRFSEGQSNFHYLAFLDGDYPNVLFGGSSSKIVSQREDIIHVLENNPNNFFVNTAGFKALVSDIF